MLATKGESIPRPEYGEKVKDGNGTATGEDEESEGEGEEEESLGKKNFEATSEEED